MIPGSFIPSGGSAIFSKGKGIRNFVGSMQFQVFLALVLFGVISNVISISAIISSNYEHAMETRVSSLNSYGQVLANSLSAAGLLKNDGSSPEVDRIDTQISLITDIYEGRVLIIDAGLRIVRDTYHLEEGKTIISEDVIRGLSGVSSTNVNKDTRLVELVLPVPKSGEPDVVEGVMVMSFSVKDIFDLQDSLWNQGEVYLLIFFLLLVAIAFVVTYQLTKPIKRVTESIQGVTEGYYQEDLPLRGYTELRQLSDSFNHMVRRLRSLEESRQNFVSNVSHELKTPITSMKVLSDSLLAQPDAPVEIYRDFMVDISQEIERENNIINDLLAMVKTDQITAAPDLHISVVNLNDLLEQTIKRLQPIAEMQGIEMIYESFRQVEAEVDEVKMSMAFSNLIENAIKYNRQDGWVRIGLNADHQYFYVKVEDSGIGIPLEEQDHIFERFYRVDQARARETGGTGLGLAITKNIILIHHGNLKLYSRPGEGSTFTMRIPLHYIERTR